MCTYVTHNVSVSGSAKGRDGWFSLSRATVYFDHPYHAPFEHTLNIDLPDLSDPSDPTRRLAIELSPESARALAGAILAALDTGEASVAGFSTESMLAYD